MSKATEFSSEGFDLDAIPRDSRNGGGEDAVFEIGGGVSSTSDSVTAKAVGDSSANASSSGSKIAPLSPEMQKAEDHKAEGNEHFKNKNYVEAIERYTDAIEAVPTDFSSGERTGDEMLQDRYDFEQAKIEKRRRQYYRDNPHGANADMLDDSNDDNIVEKEDNKSKNQTNATEEKNEEPDEQYEIPPHRHSSKLAVYYCNRAACYLHLEKYEDAIKDADVATMYNPGYVKAYIRRMTANEKLEKTDQALKDAQTALKFDPGNRSVAQHVKRLEKIEHERMEKLKEETLGKLKDLGNSILGNFGMSLDNFKATKDPNTGSYNISYSNN